MQKQLDNLFADLSSTKSRIYESCKSCQCPKFEYCSSKNTICYSQDTENKRNEVEQAGGNFHRYLDIRAKITNLVVPFVEGVSSRYAFSEEIRDDLIQEGLLSILRSIELYRVGEGARFSTYCYSRIIKYILRFLKTNSTVRNKRSVQESYRLIRKTYDRMVQDKEDITADKIHDRIMKTRENSKLCKIKFSIETVQEEMNNLMIEGRYFFESEESCLNRITDESQEEKDDFLDLLEKDLESSGEEIPIYLFEPIKMKFGILGYPRMSYEEISAVLGISLENVRKRIQTFFQRKYPGSRQLAQPENTQEEICSTALEVLY